MKDDLKKGSLQRRNPFNPTSQESLDTLEAQRKWSHDENQSSRDQIPEMKGSARLRALNKLAAKTHTRKDSETGERLFLLHRGMGAQEYKDHHKDGVANYPSGVRTSWTPKVDVPYDFAEKGQVVSAWVPESSIAHSLNQFNTYDKDITPRNGKRVGRSHTEKDEDEFIVHHNKPFKHAHKDFVETLKDKDLIDSAGLYSAGYKSGTPDSIANVSAKIQRRGIGNKITNMSNQDRSQTHDMLINTKVGAKEKEQKRAARIREAEERSKLAASEKVDNDLKKMSRGLPKFKNLPKVTTRPDQEIQNVDTNRQEKIFALKAANDSKFKQPSIRSDIEDSVRDIIKKPRNEVVAASKRVAKDKWDYDISEDELASRGVVVGGSTQKRPLGAVMGEGKIPTARRREHEGLHLSLMDLGRHYGNDIHQYAQKKMNDLIHPSVSDHLYEHLSQIGYPPNSHHRELVTHLYEMLHDPKTRNMMRHINPEFKNNEREIMGHAKKNWEAIKDFASRLKVGDEK